ncbi:MAG: N-acetylglutamate kinase [Bacteroidota bacterium]|jgi:acetylglutamate kinase
MKKLTIVKIGGNVVDDKIVLSKFLEDFSRIKGNKILIHGGGKVADKILNALQIEPKKIDGRRVTDQATLDVVTQVYAGLINKKIVATLQSHNCPALGLCGADANLLLAHQRPPKNGIDYGFAGDIDVVNIKDGNYLLKRFALVVAPITHDQRGQLLNTNADTIAATLAIAFAETFETTLTYVFEKKGVLRNILDENSVIPSIQKHDFELGKQQGIFFEGMIPKLENAFFAIEKGVKNVIICGVEGLQKSKSGTKIS